MSPFEVMHDYKPKKSIDLIPMTHHIPGYPSLHLQLHRMFMICIKRSVRKFNIIMHVIKSHYDLNYMHLEFRNDLDST